MSPATRFAPSPTGFLHLGHAFSALFAAREAERIGGRFLLRIEDIDRGRARPEFEEAIWQDLAWLGLAWEEPVRRQSDHFDFYAELVHVLEEGGVAFPCFQTRKSIASLIDSDLNAPHGPDGPVFFSPDKAIPPAEARRRIDAGEPYSIRLDAQKAARLVGDLSFTDLARGTIAVDPLIGGDIVLARKDAPVAYHLAVVADDALQGISLVTRGEDLLPACHVQRVLQVLLGLPEPQYHHHRLILDDQGRRFSKRDQAVTIKALRDSGVGPDALRRRLGWD